MANGINGDILTHYNSLAHVFQIDNETKSKWLSIGGEEKNPIPISFVSSCLDDESNNSSKRRELRIVGSGTNGSINATILPSTAFTKRSQKFGQWIDHTGTVYGVGFNSEAELNQFIETFHRLQQTIASHDSAADADSQNGDELLGSNAINASETNGPCSSGKGSMGVLSMNNNNNDSSNIISNMQQQQYSNTLAHSGHQQQLIKRQQQMQQTQATNGNISLNAGSNDSGLANNNAGAYPRSQSMFGLQSKPGNMISNNNNTLNNDYNSISSMMTGKVTPSTDKASLMTNEWQIQKQLKYENETLKQALEESSKNAGIWHSELKNLRTNNEKLTQALQESKAHVEEWDRELRSLRNENEALKLRVKGLESSNDSEKGDDYKRELNKYKSYVDEIQNEMRRKDMEIEELQKSMEELELKTPAQNGQSEDSGQVTLSPHQRQKFDFINAKLGAKIAELTTIQKEFSQALEKQYH